MFLFIAGEDLLLLIKKMLFKMNYVSALDLCCQ